MKRATLLTLVLLCGLAAAIALTAPPRADAYDITHLPAGYTTQHIVTGGNVCGDSYVIYGYGQSSAQLCTDSETFQADVDAFIAATCPVTVCVPPPPTTATTATTAPVTTAAATTTAPAVTDTTATTTTATTTTTTTAAAPAAPPAPAATTAATTTAAAPPACDLACIDSRLTALEKRVDAIAKANTASWDAFIAALNSGSSTVDAALAARSAGLNAIYQL